MFLRLSLAYRLAVCRFRLLVPVGICLSPAVLLAGSTFSVEVAGNYSAASGGDVCTVSTSGSTLPQSITRTSCGGTLAGGSWTESGFASIDSGFAQLSASLTENGNSGGHPLTTTASGLFSYSNMHLSDASVAGNLQFIYSFSGSGTMSRQGASTQNTYELSNSVSINGGSDTVILDFRDTISNQSSSSESQTLTTNQLSLGAGSVFNLTVGVDVAAYVYGSSGLNTSTLDATMQLAEVVLTDSQGNAISGVNLIDGSGAMIGVNQNLLGTPEPSYSGLLAPLLMGLLRVKRFVRVTELSR